jgi:hypothetical protein
VKIVIIALAPTEKVILSTSACDVLLIKKKIAANHFDCGYPAQRQYGDCMAQKMSQPPLFNLLTGQPHWVTFCVWAIF